MTGKCAKVIILLFVLSAMLKAQMYVSPSGSDSNPGTFDLPFKTLTKAVSKAGPDSLIYMRGGTYSYSSKVTISKNGLAGHYIKVWAYPGETPVVDFAAETSSDGISLSGSFIHLKGLEVINAFHNGINVSGHYNIIEECAIHDNRNSGFQMGSQSSLACPRGNLILNCDSYLNYDAPIGGNADGFAVKWNIGSGNVFKGCRAYNNSDDGWDLWMADTSVEIDSCFAFRNGINSWNNPAFDGNGNGFKLGGNYVTTPHLVQSCVSFDNAGNTGRGFDENNNTAGQTLYNCTAFRNRGDNYHFTNTVSLGQHVIKNCISYQGAVNITSGIRQANSWQGFTVSAGDFQSLDTSLAIAPRNPNGSLPTNAFLRLAAGSSMIDAGVYVGLPYNGVASDLGAFESASSLIIMASAGNHGTIAPTGSVTVIQGHDTTFMMLPDIGYHVDSVIVDGGYAGQMTSYTFTNVQSSHAIGAAFAINRYTLTITANNGTVALTPSQASYDTGTTVHLSAIPAGGYHFVDWGGDLSGSNNPDSIIMTANKNVTANFAIDQYTLSVNITGKGIVAKGPDRPEYDSGAVVQLTPLPDTAYRFAEWMGDVPTGHELDNPLSLLMNGNKTVEARFALNFRPLAVSRGWNMVSVPYIIIDRQKTAVFPTAVSPAFAYDDGYVPRDTLQTGIGYWLKFSAEETVVVAGSDIPFDTVNVKAGWNMIGSITKPLPATLVASIPPGLVTSQFFGYEKGYALGDTIKPGKGYWVKVSRPGRLVLSAPTSSVRVSDRIRIVPIAEHPPVPPRFEQTDEQFPVPTEYRLEQNFPNPFNPVTDVKFSICSLSHVTLTVYDVLGRGVATLVDKVMQPGEYTVSWNAGSAAGGLPSGVSSKGGYASGVYFYRLNAAGFVAVRKMLLSK